MTIATSSKATLTDCQTKALDILQREGNVFLTGAAGTGKSYLLNKYLAGKASDDFPVVASTGAAAVLVGGRTFHSFFGLGILEGGPQAAVAKALKSRRLLTRLQRASCVIIDEVSMLSGIVLKAAEVVSRLARGRDEPWGGLRIIVVGDFAQLPPITTSSELKDWAFRHSVWDESDFQPALLSTVMRTSDIEFLNVLNFIRNGIVNQQVRDYLDARTLQSSDHSVGTRLYPHRAQADEYNRRKLDSLPERLHEFPTQYEGDERAILAAKKSLPIPDVLGLKEGALVMMRKNDISGGLVYVNGSLGIVRRITDEVLYIQLLSGESIEIGREKFSVLNGDGVEICGAYNFPVSLAWATTIHKAQGASLDRLIVDLHALWEPGQAYVALSRVRSGDGLSIERWSASSIRAEPLVTSFYDALSEEAKTYVPRPLFVPPSSLPAGRQALSHTQGGKGDVEVKKPKKLSDSGKIRQQRASRMQALIEDRRSLDEISVVCEIKVDRVLLYIEKLLLEGIPMNLSYLTGAIPDADRIRSAFEELGIDRLRPVFEALGEQVNYLDIRTVRCVMVAEG